MAGDAAKAEKELQRIRKLPENRICPNCLKEDALGWTGVCMAFKTFICHECKSAHQSFSHRTKSVDMSVWKMDEVKSLDERNGGGNRAAQCKWLARVPEGARLTKDSSLEAYKKFVHQAYIDEVWIDTGGGPEASPEAGSATPGGQESSRGEKKSKKDKKEKSRSKSRGKSSDASPMDFSSSAPSPAVSYRGCLEVSQASPAAWGDWAPQGGGSYLAPAAGPPGGCGGCGAGPGGCGAGCAGGCDGGMAAASGSTESWQARGLSWAPHPGGLPSGGRYDVAGLPPALQQALPYRAQEPPSSTQPHAPSPMASDPSPGAHSAPAALARTAGCLRPLHSSNPWMPPIYPTNPWADVLLRKHLGIGVPAA